MFVVIAKSKVNAGQLIYLIKAKKKRWRAVGRGDAPPQEFATIDRARAEIRRATQELSCEVIPKTQFATLHSRSYHSTKSHLERLLDLKLGPGLTREALTVELDDEAYELSDAEWGTSDGGSSHLN